MMKRLALIVIFLILCQDALGGYSAPSRGFSAPARSYSAPSRSYSAPAREPSYTAPSKSSTESATPSYTAPAKPPLAISPAAPAYVYHQPQTVVVNQQSSGGGFGLLHYLLFWQLFRNSQPDPPGFSCHGGGCSQRVCDPLPVPSR